MNLQDRIGQIKQVLGTHFYGNIDTDSAAKAILALVEEKPTSTVYISNGLMNADMTSNTAVTPPDVTFTAPPTVSEQKPVEPTAPVGVDFEREIYGVPKYFAEWNGQKHQAVLLDDVRTLLHIVREQTIKNREREIAEGVEKLTRYDGDQYSAGVDEEVDGMYLYRDDVLALINKQ
jgi:hypothetical protein